MGLFEAEGRSREAEFGDRGSGLEARNQESGARYQVPGVRQQVSREGGGDERLPAHCLLPESGDYLTSSRGKLAAATAWPTRRVDSSGRCRATFAASAGNSFCSTSWARARMMLPPSPEVTRPRMSTCRNS